MRLMDPEDQAEALNNLTLVSMIDLVIATIGLMLDVFVISEGKSGQPYRHEGRLYPGNAFFYFAWGIVFIVCLAQGLMSINLFSGASKFDERPLKSFKKITLWLIFSICLLIILIGGGVPVFALSNQADEFYGLTITYLVVSIIFRLSAIIVVEFNRDVIKRESFFPRVIPPSSSVLSGGKLASGLNAPVYVNVSQNKKADV